MQDVEQGRAVDAQGLSRGAIQVAVADVQHDPAATRLAAEDVVDAAGPVASTAGVRPRSSRTARPVGCSMKPAPTGPAASNRSKTMTRRPCRACIRAKARPEGPAPTTATGVRARSSGRDQFDQVEVGLVLRARG